jgi:hypothetical protein
MIDRTCAGCGAALAVECTGPGKYFVFHPAPLCAHILGLIEAGKIDGPVVDARRDLVTGDVVVDETRPS